MKIPSLHVSLTPAGMDIIRWAQWGLVFLVSGLIIWSLWIWQEHHRLSGQIEELHTAITVAQEANQAFISQAREAGVALTPARRKSIDQEVAFANHLHAHQIFSWTQFLSDLESAVPPGISMASVRPDFDTHSILLGGSALTLNEIQTLVETLEAHPAFTDVVLSNHTMKTKGKNNPKPFMVFTLLVTYQPAT